MIAFPHEWQRPAKTEEWVYEILTKNRIGSQFVEFICFPWATLIDLISRGKKARADYLLAALSCLPHKKTLIRATACQHINIELINEYLSSIKITDIFWSHNSALKFGTCNVRYHDLPLYPVNYYEQEIIEPKELIDRRYLISFVGAYDKYGYISDVREKIFNLPARPDVFIKRRNKWHYEDIVYKSQINDEILSDEAIISVKKNSIEYASVMRETVFSLCPSGAGVNTIRLWESICYQCIPIVLSDSYHSGITVGGVHVKEIDLQLFFNEIVDRKDSGLITKDFLSSLRPAKIDLNSFVLDIFVDFFSKEKVLSNIKSKGF